MNGLMPPATASPALPYGEWVVPLLVAQEGERAAKRYVEFFADNIRNPNTRRAYARAAGDFLGWCEQRGLALATIEPVHVAGIVNLLEAEACLTVRWGDTEAYAAICAQVSCCQTRKALARTRRY